MTDTLSDLAFAVLTATDGDQKARLSVENAARWQNAEITQIGFAAAPDRPGRPERPPLLAPAEMPRRRGVSDKARATLLHAVLHIELNAIDLAWDMVLRFSDQGMPKAFFDDWVKVGAEEGKHFQLLQKRIRKLGFEYGDFPAHDGLWEAAFETRNNFAARLAIVPMVLEARG
ncbi:ferritin-like domain-containing protein [Sneathiella glossodoripedis]|uniref:ferritin-like domain-containing protein n=1 Tax=Sneathiella glossodoripedis TaxID=418853 RepID=UPI000AED0840|nr:ferritin-like domain-containing protein [Sneathiella glossodoripedis]